MSMGWVVSPALAQQRMAVNERGVRVGPLAPSAGHRYEAS